MLDNIKYIKEKNLLLKLSLCLNSILIESNEIYNKSSINNLLKNFSELNEILNLKKDNICKFLYYYNKKNIHNILYNFDKVIKIDSYIINKNLSLSTFFYLVLLIEENKNIINYEYSLNFIKNIYEQYKNDNNNNDNDIYKNIIITKIIIELIRNYKGTERYHKEKDKDELDIIENYFINKIKNSLNAINELGFKLDENNIRQKNIDEIYIEIINKLIITNKIDNNTFNIINQLDLINIDITKTIFDALCSTLKENIINKYLIINNNDLFEQNKINFYYILSKYILKKSLYIYQIPFLLKSRINIINIIKNNNISFNNINSDKKEKLDYIFKFIIDSEYIYDKIYLKKIKENESNNITSQINIETMPIPESKTLSNRNELPKKQKTIIINENELYYQIVNFEKILETHKEPIYSTKFIKELNKKYIITGGPGDILYIYDEQNNLKDMINFNILEKKDQSYQLPTAMNSNIINNENLFSLKKTQNIFEINPNNNKEENIDVIDCSKNGLFLYSMNLNNLNQIEIKKKLNLSVSKFFVINNNSYVCIGEKGIFHFDKLYDINRIEDYKIYESNKKVEKSYKGGIKINDNYIVITSNSILIKGEDKLLIYDTKKKKIIQNIDGSFVADINGLSLMDIKDQKDVKIILCACKKYREEQNNGILILNSKIEENKKLNPNFINTNNFEVNCFCPIKIKINNKMEKTNYFFAGGFENDSKQGLIKLYEVIYKKSDDNKENIEIIFLQDVEFDNNGEFQGFQRTVNCIFQNKSNGKILVSCWDGNIYLFSPPNLEFYLNENVNNITKILKEN